jgi:hypothetical protein
MMDAVETARHNGMWGGEIRAELMSEPSEKVGMDGSLD